MPLTSVLYFGTPCLFDDGRQVFQGKLQYSIPDKQVGKNRAKVKCVLALFLDVCGHVAYVLYKFVVCPA